MRPVTIHPHDVITGVGYGASTGSIIVSILNSFTYEQWNALGVLAGIGIGLATFLTNLYYRRKDDQRRERKSHEDEK